MENVVIILNRNFNKQRGFVVFLFIKLHYARGNNLRQRLSAQSVTAFMYSVCHHKTGVRFSYPLDRNSLARTPNNTPILCLYVS